MRNKRKKHESFGNQSKVSLLTPDDDCRDADQTIELNLMDLVRLYSLLLQSVEFLEDLVISEEREFDA